MKSFDELSNEFFLDDEVHKEDISPEAYDKYLTGVNEILEQDNSNIDALKFKYFILFCQKKYEEGIEICDLVLRKRPDDIEAMDFKASMFELSRYKEDIEIWQRILEIDPENKDALEQWDRAYVMSDDNTLPKPPETILSKIIKIILLIAILGGIIYFLLK